MKRFFNAILTLSLLAFVGCGELVENFADYVNGTLAPGGSGNSENTGTTESTQVVYKVGDYYNVNGKKGVVFWVDESGKHGKIVSLSESSNGLLWSSDTNEQKRLIGADDKDNGANNIAVVKHISDWQSKYPAFKWCADLGEGWYLPAINELRLFTLNASVNDAVNQTLAIKGKKINPNLYWSSTEYNYQHSTGEFCALYVVMSDGKTPIGVKYFDLYVRAVSAF